ncbi:lysophospholipid acyltransferase family protein [Candidatus Pelagibacter bacterium nBUS_49]|uniref:lysophospholipid acyltransferase family protein n=1 Tax=Candidatus Pelagibacter bacterium nBUS_49 TaxID=3374196 RepID=UPI003EB9C58F
MKLIKYFFQFLFIIFFFSLFKIFGFKISSKIGGKLFEIIGPVFRSKKLIHTNIKKAFPKNNSVEIKKLTKLMWNNYGRVFAEYMFIKDFRFEKIDSKIEIVGQEILDEIKKSNKPVVFISGHFSNFELMAMQIEKAGIELSAIYRPLNNIFLNRIMEKIRKKYICRNQIKKGIAGTRELIKFQRNNYSIALMIDQRVSEGKKVNFFNQEAYTTTIPAQLAKKFDMPIVPIFIERVNDTNFKIKISKPINFLKSDSIKDITSKLNVIIEEMILKNPTQWIWSHNRWK